MHYLRVAAHELGRRAQGAGRGCAERSSPRYGWPGNVRELVNLCRRLTVLAPGSEIHVEDLPPEARRRAGARQRCRLGQALAGWAERQRAGRQPAAAR